MRGEPGEDGGEVRGEPGEDDGEGVRGEPGEDGGGRGGGTRLPSPVPGPWAPPTSPRGSLSGGTSTAQRAAPAYKAPQPRSQLSRGWSWPPPTGPLTSIEEAMEKALGRIAGMRSNR